MTSPPRPVVVVKTRNPFSLHRPWGFNPSLVPPVPVPEDGERPQFPKTESDVKKIVKGKQDECGS